MKTNGSLRVLKYPELVGGLILLFFKNTWNRWLFEFDFLKMPKRRKWVFEKLKKQHNTLLFSLVFF
jgi:hypothetical protein